MLKRKYYYIAALVVVLVIALEIGFRIIQSPNLVDKGSGQSFLLTTTWNQTGPYAKYVKYDNDAGCWAVAIAQIAHYHNLVPSGQVEYVTSKGNNISINPDDYIFRREQIVSNIDEQTSSAETEQVAKYIYYIAALIYTDFGSSGYLEHETMMSRIEQHLNCDVDFYEYNKNEYVENMDKIITLISQEIDSSHPMMIYFDDGKDFGHAAVIDGYLNTDDGFLIHMNMGWGGKYNGWYDAFDKFIGIRDDLQNRFLIAFKERSDGNK